MLLSNRFETNRKNQFFYINNTKVNKSNYREVLTPINTSMASELIFFLDDWYNDSPLISVQTSGSTGTPKQISVRKSAMIRSAILTCSTLNLKQNDSALLCMSLKYIAGKMMIVRALTASLSLIITNPTGHPLKNIKTPIRFAAMVPLQVYNSIHDTNELEKLKQIDILIIGGAAIDNELESIIRDLPNQIFSTYGMTETLSHIALRRLNGSSASFYYTPMPSVEISLSTHNTLIINAPEICEETLTTNDVVKIENDGRFLILGRKDNIINSGGIKIQIETLEAQYKTFLTNNFALTGIPNNKLGEALVLLYENTKNPKTIEQLRDEIENRIPKYQRAREIFLVDKLPLTETCKINRHSCKELAIKLSKK